MVVGDDGWWFGNFLLFVIKSISIFIYLFETDDDDVNDVLGFS